MQRIKFICFALTLLLGACSISSKKNVERLTLRPSSVIQDSMFTQMPGVLLLCPPYLVWEDPFNSEHFLHVVDITAKKEIGVMGEIGRGPKEFITPVSFQSIGHKVFTLDLNQHKQAYYSVDSLVAGKEPFIPCPLDAIKDCFITVQIAENDFISISPRGEHLFQWIHPDSSVTYFGKCPIKEILSPDENDQARTGDLEYNPCNNKLVYSAKRIPYFALYEKQGDTFQLVREKTSSKRSYEIKNDRFHFFNDQQTPSEIVLTKDYIIALQQDEDTELPRQERTSGIRDFSKVPNTILVYDYEFNLQKIINMSMPILRITGNCDSNTLYAVGIDLDFCILTYEI